MSHADQSRGGNSTRTSRLISAPREAVYPAFVDPEALVTWQAPGEMTARIERFDERIGGGYEMVLRYPESTEGAPGKSGEREDRYSARFLDLEPPSRIVEAIAFATDDPAFGGEMLMTVTLEERAGGTEVTIACDGIPPGIRPEDNDEGTRSSLEKLTRLVEASR